MTGLFSERIFAHPNPRAECDDLQWCPLNALPENTIPFVRRAIEHHLRSGTWFDEIGREVVVAITNGRLDFGPWEQIFYGEFDGHRRKRVLIKIIGE